MGNGSFGKLKLARKDSESQVVVKTLKGKVIKLQNESNDIIHKQRLIFVWRKLEDGCTLADYNIDNSLIHLIMSKHGIFILDTCFKVPEWRYRGCEDVPQRVATLLKKNGEKPMVQGECQEAMPSEMNSATKNETVSVKTPETLEHNAAVSAKDPEEEMGLVDAPPNIYEDNTASSDKMSQKSEKEKGSVDAPQPMKLEQIFVKGLLPHTVSMQFDLLRSTYGLVEEIHKRTGLNAGDCYFTCNGKLLNTYQTLLEQGVSKDCDVHYNPRMRGGRQLLSQHLNNMDQFLKWTYLPNGTRCPELTDRGCVLLTSLMHSVTNALFAGNSWGGALTLNCFEVEGDQVFIRLEPTFPATATRIKKDLKQLAGIIQWKFTWAGYMPPYLLHLLRLLRRSVPDLDYLGEDLKFLLDTHVSMIPSKKREALIVELMCLYQSLDATASQEFVNAIGSGVEAHTNEYNQDWYVDSLRDGVMYLVHRYAKLKGSGYQDNSVLDAFRFMRNFVIHGPENSYDKDQGIHLYAYDSSLEVLMYSKFGDFLALIVESLCAAGFDISSVLRYGLHPYSV